MSVLMRYILPGCKEEGTWLLWESYSAVAVAVTVFVSRVLCFCTLLHIVTFCVFATNGVKMKDGELSGTSKYVKRTGILIRVYSMLTNIADLSKPIQTLKNISEHVDKS